MSCFHYLCDCAIQLYILDFFKKKKVKGFVYIFIFMIIIIALASACRFLYKEINLLLEGEMEDDKH